MTDRLARAGTISGPPLIAFTGGGTAGHVFPGIAVAEALSCRVVWIGSTKGVEKRLVTQAGIDFRGIPAGKLRRYFSLRNLSDVARTIAGVIAAVRILRREKPALLFSKGGFVSVPPVVAARLCGIPSFTHESDFDPGLATRINIRFCERVLVSFPETVSFLSPPYRSKAIVTGNPVRRSLYNADPARGRRFVGCDGSLPVIFVTGGSLGSSFLNSLVSSTRARLSSISFIVHQMGAREYVPTEERNYFPAAFFGQELPDIMAAADLVISRAGANTLAEFAALGKPSLLIPLPASASRGDQIRNADFFARRGASLVLQEQEASEEAFVSTVSALLEDRTRRERMGQAAATLGTGRPAQAIAALILERLG